MEKITAGICNPLREVSSTLQVSVFAQTKSGLFQAENLGLTKSPRNLARLLSQTPIEREMFILLMQLHWYEKYDWIYKQWESQLEG